jgi:hypothetical protein
VVACLSTMSPMAPRASRRAAEAASRYGGSIGLSSARKAALHWAMGMASPEWMEGCYWDGNTRPYPSRAFSVTGLRPAKAFAQDDADTARLQWRRVADQLRPQLPR